jgi:hypothetical protein
MDFNVIQFDILINFKVYFSKEKKFRKALMTEVIGNLLEHSIFEQIVHMLFTKYTF